MIRRDPDPAPVLLPAHTASVALLLAAVALATPALSASALSPRLGADGPGPPPTWFDLYATPAVPEHFAGAVATDDGGVLAVGTVQLEGENRLWMVRLDADGRRLGEQVVADQQLEAAAVTRLADGAFVVVANTHGSAGRDFVVLGFGGPGGESWALRFSGQGPDNSDHAREVISTRDGGFLVAGQTYSFLGCENFCPSEAFLVKGRADGSIEWQKLYGDGMPFSFGTDEFWEVAEGADGYLAVGSVEGLLKPWAVKVGLDGSMEWESTYTAAGTLAFFSGVTAIGDGLGFVAAGSGPVPQPPGKYDARLVAVSAGGELLWQRSYATGEGLEDLLHPQVAKTPGGLLLSGEGPSGLYVLGVTERGEPIDAKIYRPNLPGFVQAEAIAGSPESGFYVVGGNWEYPEWREGIVARVGADGRIDACPICEDLEVAEREITETPIPLGAMEQDVSWVVTDAGLELRSFTADSRRVCPE